MEGKLNYISQEFNKLRYNIRFNRSELINNTTATTVKAFGRKETCRISQYKPKYLSDFSNCKIYIPVDW